MVLFFPHMIVVIHFKYITHWSTIILFLIHLLLQLHTLKVMFVPECSFFSYLALAHPTSKVCKDSSSPKLSFILIHVQQSSLKYA